MVLKRSILNLKNQYTKTQDMHKLLYDRLDDWALWLSTYSIYTKDSPNEQDQQKYKESLDILIERIQHIQNSFRMSDQDLQDTLTSTKITKEKREPSIPEVKNKCDKGSKSQQAEKIRIEHFLHAQDSFKISNKDSQGISTSTKITKEKIREPSIPEVKNKCDKGSTSQQAEKIRIKHFSYPQDSFKKSNKDSQGISTSTKITKEKREFSIPKVKNKYDKGSKSQQAEKIRIEHFSYPRDSFKKSNKDLQGTSTSTKITKKKRESSIPKVKNKYDKGSKSQQAKKIQIEHFSYPRDSFKKSNKDSPDTSTSTKITKEERESSIPEVKNKYNKRSKSQQAEKIQMEHFSYPRDSFKKSNKDSPGTSISTKITKEKRRPSIPEVKNKYDKGSKSQQAQKIRIEHFSHAQDSFRISNKDSQGTSSKASAKIAEEEKREPLITEVKSKNKKVAGAKARHAERFRLKRFTFVEHSFTIANQDSQGISIPTKIAKKKKKGALHSRSKKQIKKSKE